MNFKKRRWVRGGSVAARQAARPRQGLTFAFVFSFKKYLTYLSKRVYQSWKDCSNLRVWSNWFEALNPRPCPRGQCSFVVVRRAKIFIFSLTRKNYRRLLMKAESTEMCSWKEKVCLKFYCLFVLWTKIICRSKDILVRKVGHCRTLVAIKTDEF